MEWFLYHCQSKGSISLLNLVFFLHQNHGSDILRQKGFQDKLFLRINFPNFCNQTSLLFPAWFFRCLQVLRRCQLLCHICSHFLTLKSQIKSPKLKLMQTHFQRRWSHQLGLEVCLELYVWTTFLSGGMERSLLVQQLKSQSY